LDVKWQLPFLDRFRLIAEAVDKRREAEFWIARYHQRAREIREELAAHVPSCRTVSFFWSQGLPDTFQVYYDIQVLYKALAFASPPAVQAVQRLTDHPFKSDVPVADLPLYAGDYIFIVVSDDERSQCRFLELTRSALWRNLPAVRDG
ncbi:hypothetical protein K0U00_48145, partial [Paenibacillus sepulcri]|nr:hypothetical protein [Paenibacillus sepulcri]